MNVWVSGNDVVVNIYVVFFIIIIYMSHVNVMFMG